MSTHNQNRLEEIKVKPIPGIRAAGEEVPAVCHSEWRLIIAVVRMIDSERKLLFFICGCFVRIYMGKGMLLHLWYDEPQKRFIGSFG